MKKIAILHYAYLPNIGGVEILVDQQAEILKRLGFDVTIFTGLGKKQENNIEVVEIKEFQSLSIINQSLHQKVTQEAIIEEDFYIFSERIEKILSEKLAHFDTIIVHNMMSLHLNLPFVDAFNKFSNKNKHINVIIWIHDHKYVENEKIIRHKFNPSKVEEFLLTSRNKNWKYVTISSTFKKLIDEVYVDTAPETLVINNGIHIKKFFNFSDHLWEIVTEHDWTEKYPLIVTPANVIERKNYEYMVNVIAELRKEFPDICYVITGKTSGHKNTEKYMDKILELIQRLDMTNNTFFISKAVKDNLSTQDIRNIYSFSDAILYLSRSENFGLPILESAFSKTPIFLSNLKVFHEISEDNALYIDTDSTSYKEASLYIKEKLQKNKLSQLLRKAKKSYNLEKLIETKLVPIL